MATSKLVFTLRLEEDNFEKIKFIADKNKRSIAMQIEYIIEQHVIDPRCESMKPVRRGEARMPPSLL